MLGLRPCGGLYLGQSAAICPSDRHERKLCLLLPIQRPFLKRHAPRYTIVRAAAGNAQVESPFQQEQKLDSLQSAAASLPGPAAAFSAVVLVAVAAAVGVLTGGQSPAAWRTVGRAGGGLLGAALGAVLVKQLQEKRCQAAALMLHNLLVSKADPATLTRQEVEEINSRFGVDLAAKQTADVARVYGIYLESIIPKGETPLTGQEPGQVRAFKEALGLTDTDAAPVHLDVGRRFVRSSYEAGSREANALERKTFQKLIFVSQLVFGERQAAFLLPWERTFRMTGSQLQVAVRDSGKALFRSFLDSRGGQLEADRVQLTELRSYQQSVRLGDDVATEIVKDALRARVEGFLDEAVAVTKKRDKERDNTDAVKQLEKLLDFNRKLDELAGDKDVVPGLARTSVWGGKYDSSSGEGRARDLHPLFRIFLEEKLKERGSMDATLENDLSDLQLAMGLGPNEAKSIRDEVITAAYRRLLRDEFRSKRLEQAPKKAQALQALCDRIGYDPEAAVSVHKGIFVERMDKFLADGKNITDDEEKELKNLRRLLCLTAEQVQEIEKTTKGRIYAAAVNDALGAGIDNFTVEDRKAVRDARAAVHLSQPVAKAILKDIARKAFLGFISRSRTQRNKLDGAKELKKLVFFSNICVTPLLEDLQSEEEVKAAADAARAAREAADKKTKNEAAMKEFAETMAKAKEEADKEKAAEEAGESYTPPPEMKAKKAALEEGPPTEEDEEDRPATLAKSQDAAAARAEGEEIGETGATMKSQKEVNLRDDLEIRDRTDIYRNFLLYCMSGDVVALPMGTSVVVERDTSDFARLAQLGDILGLTQFDVASVHQGMAEQSYRHQVQTIMADGQLTKERSETLTSMRTKMGLSEDAASKIIKGVQNQRMLGNLQAKKSAGALTLQSLLEMSESGVDTSSFLSEDHRAQLFSKEVQEQLGNGKGDFDAQKMLKDIPAQLKISQKKVDSAMKILVKDRRRTTLVQAISLLRQKKLDDASKSVNNLLALERAVPTSATVTWNDKSELQDLYSIYSARESDPDKQAAIAHMFSLSEDEAANLRDIVAEGNFKLEEEAQETNSFF